jgi:hypothetical protein
MAHARRWTQVIGALSVLIVVVAATPALARQRISAELEASQLSVVNGVAEATFKIIVKNDEPAAITGVFLVFDDGFEVTIGDVAGEASGASESTTRTFEVGEQETLNVPFPARLKYSVDGTPVEQQVNIILRLGQ